MRWYDANVDGLVRSYEAIPADQVHGWLIPFLPDAPALVLDVGAGTGRDAAWLASLGHRIVAVEPTPSMLSEARRLHASPSIQWLDDRLPGLESVHRLGLSFDLILLSAVWMHVDSADRSRAFRKLVTLLKPGAAIAITLRHGPSDDNRGISDVTQEEIEHLARAHGGFVERATTSKDKMGRGSVHWTELLVRLPDDGTGALPLLRHIILNDDKSSTYKLALLRVICRIADTAYGYARITDDGHVGIPFGLVGLYWIRLFMPLLTTNLPQSPTNEGLDRLGFVREGFRGLLDLSQLDFRIGVQFSEDRSTALHSALRDACDTIARMPATYMAYPDGKPVMPVHQRARVPRPRNVRLDESYLSSFGELLVPDHLWRAFQRFDVWIEPALVHEWSRLIRTYAARRGRHINDEAMAAAMTWADPSRDVRIAKEQAIKLLSANKLHCVWTGRALSQGTLDIDHCFPWAAWPCEDLWNLLPALRKVNQSEKRDKLPSIELLRSAEDRIKAWWSTAYLDADSEDLRNRFIIGAKATLPSASMGEVHLDEIFNSLELLQMRLRNDQQIPVWEG